MHRSGTSYLTKRTSDFYKASLPNDLMKDKLDNIEGHFESHALSSLNERILQSLGSNWFDAKIHTKQMQLNSYKKFKKILSIALENAFSGNKRIVIKDPRIMKLYYLWERCLMDNGFNLEIISITRNPSQITTSLIIRDGFSKMYAELLTFSYHLAFLDILKDISGKHIHHINYEDIKNSLPKNKFLKYLHAGFKNSKNEPSECLYDQSGSIVHDINQRNCENFRSYKLFLVKKVNSLQVQNEIPKSLFEISTISQDRDGWKEKSLGLEDSLAQLNSALKLAEKDKVKIKSDLDKILNDRDGWKEKSQNLIHAISLLEADRDGWKEKSQNLIHAISLLEADRDGWKKNSINNEEEIAYLKKIISDFQNTFIHKFIQKPVSIFKNYAKDKLYIVASFFYRKLFIHLGVKQSYINKIKIFLKHSTVRKRIQKIEQRDIEELKVPPKSFSIIIPTYGKHELTKKCLASLVQNNNLEKSEIILVDDCFNDPLARYISDTALVKIIRNEKNLGFVGSCNNGAKHAKNDFLIFLNNDTEVHLNWAYYLIKHVFENPKNIAGSKLIFENGKLQESGGLLWRDGSGWNVGREQDQNKDLFSFTRKVDYVSGASLCIKKSNFEKIKRFGEEYTPGYFEDADLCFKNRKNGGDVYVVPRSVAIHKEGGTSGTDPNKGMKKFQNKNLKKFKKIWAEELAKKNKNGENFEDEFARYYPKSILIIDEETPQKNRDAGSVTAFYFMKIMVEMGFYVTFLPRNLHYTNEHTELLQDIGVNCVYGAEHENIIQYLEKVSFQYDYVMLNRCEIANDYIDIIKKKLKNTKIIFNTVDLHFLREERERGNELNSHTKNKELSVMKKSNKVIVLSEYENQLLTQKFNIQNIQTIPLVFENFEKSTLKRENFIFVGNFRHAPNIDSIKWFVKNVWSKDFIKFKPHKLHVVGTHIDKELFNFLSRFENVVIDGFVEDLDGYIKNFLLNIAPITYGAGIKGKIGHASCFGIPTITSPLGAEGMNFTNKFDIYVSELDSFSEELQKLISNQELINKISNNAFDFAFKNYSKDAIKKRLLKVLE